MIDIFKKFFSADTGGRSDAPEGQSEHDIRVATCALLLEMGRIDEKFSEAEMTAVIDMLKERYGLSDEHIDALMAVADEELAQSVDLWRFAERINRHYSQQEKIDIIELLWRLVFVDQKMNEYENYLMHRVGNLLRLSHKELMDAKVKVLRSNQKS